MSTTISSHHKVATAPSTHTRRSLHPATSTADVNAGSVEAAPVPSRQAIAAAAGRTHRTPQPLPTQATTPDAGPGQPNNLNNFKLTDLQQFTSQKIDPNADFQIFYAGKDNIHGILNYLMSSATKSVNLNMYGYDDPDLNAQCMRCAADPSMQTAITLDKSQAEGGHERALLQGDEQQNATAFNNHFVIGDSATDQISHTKGGVLDDKVGFEGSVNWSSEGEGTFVNGSEAPGGAGYKAQNNTLCVFTNPTQIANFKAELQSEHQIAARQGTTLANLPTARTS